MKFNIENYESMTTEEKLAALEAYEPDMTGFVSKTVLDRTASELAATKKMLRERMTEDEAKKAEEAAERAAAAARTKELEERVKELETERTVSSYTAAYLAMGYDEKLAKASAEAMAKGDMDTVFQNQKRHNESREQALRTELLKKTPSPVAGSLGVGMTKEVFAKLPLDEKRDFAEQHPEEYKQFYGGN